MVIGEKFVWAHMPKTGGDSTFDMFQVISKHITFKADPKEENLKHETFQYRENKTGKVFKNSLAKILNIRRLPFYALSLANHHFKYNNIHIDKACIINGGVKMLKSKDKILSPEDLYEILKIDYILYSYELSGINYWLRTEYLADDFISVMGKFIDIPEEDKIEIQKIKSNINEDYNKDLNQNFTKKELQELYNNCPLWSFIERKVYGNLLID